MGMSASQARLLSITSRINDIEFKSQQISNVKVRLADESEQVAQDYTKALNKTKLTYTSYTSGSAQKIDLNSTNLRNALKDNFRLVDASGNAVSLYDAKDNKTGMKFTESQLYEMIESGQFMLQAIEKDDDGNNKWVDTSVSGNNQLAIESDTTELAKAEAEYNAASAKINKKEKLLDNDLKALDTEHNALKTEFDSVKSLIGDNVEKSFNLFS
ncbi:hypothetical protein IJ707_03280 [bacterium]|nr:hypothetical protein [bacterium]